MKKGLNQAQGLAKFSARNNFNNCFRQDSWESFDSWGSADAWESANGGGAAAAPSRVSTPYIIQIVNTCSAAISNVDIGDSYTNRTTGTYSNGNLVPSGQPSITISSTVVGVTYLEFLAQSESQPFKIGRTMIITSGANAGGQLDQTVVVTHRDSAGNRNDHVITPTIDPYQNQTDRIIDDYEYLFDGFTRLRFNQINASACTVTTRLYPTNKFAATQLVAGRQANIPFAAPHLIKVAPTAVPAPQFLPGGRS